MKVLGIYGAGGFAREIKPILQRQLLASGAEKTKVSFIDDNPRLIGTRVNGATVLSYDEFRSIDNKEVCLAFSDPLIRKRKAEQVMADGLTFCTISSPKHHKDENVTVGEGCVFSHYSLVESNVEVGNHFHCNMYSYVAHDCKVGDFVTFAPRVSLNGNVIVEDLTFVGCGAVILQGSNIEPVVIGRGAVVGAGAVVTESVAPGTTVVGVPAKPIR